MRRFYCDAQHLTLQNPHLNQFSPDERETLASNQSLLSLSSLASGSLLTLPDDVYHHWCRVLRAKIGEQSILFDGFGGQTYVELTDIDKKQATVQVLSHQYEDYTPCFFSTIAIVMSRGDRMDYAIQKSTELGATTIQLLTSQNGEVRLKANQIDKKMNHWQQVALSACEQCGLNRPPIILSPLSIEDWLNNKLESRHNKGNKTVSHLTGTTFYQQYLTTPPIQLVLAVPSQDEAKKLNVNKQIADLLSHSTQNSTYAKPRFDILIGAEGGLTKSEYDLARHAGYLPWQLGSRVLRTETAPVVALSTLMYMSSLSIN